jgi:hypothetical protein
VSAELAAGDPAASRRVVVDDGCENERLASSPSSDSQVGERMMKFVFICL